MQNICFSEVLTTQELYSKWQQLTKCQNIPVICDDINICGRY